MTFKKILYLFTAILPVFIIASCKTNKSNEENTDVKFNLIKPSSGIYAVIEKNVPESKTVNHYFEKNTFEKNKLIKVERFDKSGKLTDGLFVPAVTAFEYDAQNRVKYLRYFDKVGRPALNPKFNYSSVEYIYNNAGRVIVEIYRDKDFKLLKVPKDNSGKIKQNGFIAPVLAYIYNNKNLLIKAFDENFNLIKETTGQKPCIPFIDCGEN